jgi:hypothetical protein
MSEHQFFSEQEATEVIKRAAALQERLHSTSTDIPGLTREELIRIAGEMGLSAEAVEQAIAAGDEKELRHGMFSTSYQRVVNRGLEPEDFDLVHDLVGPRKGREGVRQMGRTLSGRVSRGIGYGQVEITSRKGRTRIEVTSSPLVAVLLALYPGVVGALISLAYLARDGQMVAGIAAGLGFLGVGALAFRFLLGHGQARMKALADELKRKIEEEGPAPPMDNRPRQDPS